MSSKRNFFRRPCLLDYGRSIDKVSTLKAFKLSYVNLLSFGDTFPQLRGICYLLGMVAQSNFRDVVSSLNPR
jgi:hypothetical protein